MELRHLKYFIAVAEEGNLTLAAERRLHTAQPSLSRQIRDLEYELGVPLLKRSARGVKLTKGGEIFLDLARLVLAQVVAAVRAARQAGKPARPSFALGFLTGHGAAKRPVTHYRRYCFQPVFAPARRSAGDWPAGSGSDAARVRPAGAGLSDDRFGAAIGGDAE